MGNMHKGNSIDLRENSLQSVRHSLAHLLAIAVLKKFPKAKLGIGPTIENGFYYDFKLPRPLRDEELAEIENTMREVIAQNLDFKGEKLTPQKARSVFKEQPFKLDLIKELVKDKKALTGYRTGTFFDLCRGGHVKNTSEIPHDAFTLTKTAGAYWRGDEKNPMLTRIYGLAFETKADLNAHLAMLAEAEKRDHRKLGQELDLYSISPLVGQGLILWHPKLTQVRNVLEAYWKEKHYRKGYQLVNTPHIANMDLFVISRHLSKYTNSMFPVMLHEYIEGESAPDYQVDEILKPMNCPGHIQIYKSRPHSYRELPLRIGELGTVYRYERAGVLQGLTRVRGFTQDDSHIFCTPEQVIDEVRGVLQIMKEMYALFGFNDYQAYIATRPAKYLGTLKMWNLAEEALKEATRAEGCDYKIDEGEGVFYGPKIDMKVKDSLGREWQLGTVQFDFNQPDHAETTEEEINEFWNLKIFKKKFKTRENAAKHLKKLGRGFNVTYTDRDGSEKQCVMIHRVIFGSMERFMGILIEHFAGAFPLWLAPVQIKILTINDAVIKYGAGVEKQLRDAGYRVELDSRNETIGKKIREAEMQKIPYLLIIGNKEAEARTVAVRARGKGDIGQMTLDAFSAILTKETTNH